MILGGSLLGVGTSGSGYYMATTLPYASPQGAPAAATSVAAGGGTQGMSTARMQQLLQGAAPATAAEQQWTTGVEQGLRGYVQTLTSLAAAQRSAPREDHAFEQQVLVLVNQQRALHGLAPLAYDSRLDLASERHNQVQAATRSMAHSGIGDGDPGSRIRATGFTGAWGENVATGQLTPEQVVSEWMASPGHRRNILDPNYRRLGVAYGQAADGRTYWAQSFGA